MGSFKSTILTAKAHNLMAKLTAGTATSVFTKIRSSDHDYSALTSSQLEALTAIEDIKQEVTVSEVKRINDASVKVTATLVNTALTTGYYIKTIGLYANDPDEGEILYSVTVAIESDWMPPFNNISSASALYELVTTVSNADNVSIEVDPNATVAITTFNEFKENVNTQLSKIAYMVKSNGVDDTETLQNALNTYKDILIPDANYYITNDINLNINQRLWGNINTAINGNGHKIKLSGTYLNPFAVASLVANIITITDMTGFNMLVGDVIQLKGDHVSIFSEILAIDAIAKTVTIADWIDFTITGTLQLYKAQKANTSIKHIILDNVKVEINDNLYSGTIRECKFRSNSGIGLSGVAHFTIADNDFNNTDDSIFTHDCCFIDVLDNTIVNFANAIRNEYCYGILVRGNTIKNGRNANYSVGIEFTGSNGVIETNKSSNNKIIGNTVINAQKGVPGSAIGGIHLNFNTHNTIIAYNISNQNGIGIYLENANKDIIVKGNICNHNNAYYGVGIELDWDSEDVLIDGNICNYNLGSIEAGESIGIEIRAGESTGHTNKRITVVNNTCRYNGKEGIRANGTDVTVNNNNVNNNGTGTFTLKAQIYADDINGLIMTNNTITDTTGTNHYSIYISNPTNAKINNNKIRVGNNAVSCVLITGLLTNVEYLNNDLKGDANQRLISFAGTTGSKYVKVKDNMINASNDSGYNALELNNIDTYQQKDNILITNTRILEYQCTNKIA